MRYKKAVITDTEKHLSRIISRKLNKLGYKVKIINGRKAPPHRIDLLVSGTFRYEAICGMVGCIGSRGQIIAVGSTADISGENRNRYILRSYGCEQLLRERMRETSVCISFVRQGFGGTSILDDTNSRYQIHSADTKQSIKYLADAVAAIAETPDNVDYYCTCEK